MVIDSNMLTSEESTSAISHRPRDGSLTQSPPETELGGESPNARVTRDAAVNEDVATRRALQMMTSLTVQPTADPQTVHTFASIGSSACMKIEKVSPLNSL